MSESIMRKDLHELENPRCKYHRKRVRQSTENILRQDRIILLR
jgi:hypothetical protein